MKTKLGISARFLAAAIYCCALFGGYTPLFLLTGYVLIIESNDWLKYVSVKAISLSFAFSIAVVLIGLIPNAFDIISNMLSIFNVYAAFDFVTKAQLIVSGLTSIAKTLLFLLLAIKALNLKDFSIKKLDKFVNELI